MSRVLQGLAVFAGAVALAVVLYGLTLPGGLPWGISPYWHCAWIWAAVAAGFIGVLVYGYFGWKVSAAAALAWTFMPAVWNGAVLGARTVALVSMGVVGLWVLNIVMLWAMRYVWLIRFDEPMDAASEMFGEEARLRKVKSIVSRSLLGTAVAFAVASLALHDYRLGKAAAVYARGIVAEAGGRTIMLNGVADGQVEMEVEKWRGGEVEKCPPPPLLSTLSLRCDDGYRKKVLAWARAEWPDETDLAVVAQVSVATFVDEAVRKHPERFYLMSGGSTTAEGWDRRWAAFVPYLKSSDAFVPIGRRLFAYEGNAVANRLQDTDKTAAWNLYWRICREVEDGNIAAVINLSEMMRKGYAATEKEREDVRVLFDAFFSNGHNRRHAREIVRPHGPVRADPEMLAKAAEGANAAGERGQDGEKNPVPPEWKTLLEWNDKMVVAVERGETGDAARIARKILSNPKWRGWIPANAVMGGVAASEGDYAASEVFYRTATAGTNETPALVWNNYADTLMRLGKTDEAEAILRRGIGRTGKKFYPLRVTLAEVLTAKAKRLEASGEEAELAAARKEVAELVASVMLNAPADVIRQVHEEQRRGEILK